MPPISIIIIPKSQPASHLKAVLPLPSQQSDQQQVKTHQMNADNFDVYLSSNFFPSPTYSWQDQTSQLLLLLNRYHHKGCRQKKKKAQGLAFYHYNF